MKIFLAIVGALILLWVVSVIMPSGQKSELNTSRPPLSQKPTRLVQNDKIIVVMGVTYVDIKKALTDFCNIYNNKDFAVLPRLTKISDSEFAITFPYDTQFESYAFLVNYLKYPKGITWNANVLAWATAKTSDTWITEKSANKKVMLFLADDDKEYDNVFLTTEDGIGYKLGFALGEEKQLLDTPNKAYVPPTVDINSLTGKTSEDFQ